MTTQSVTVSGGFHNVGEITLRVDEKLSAGQYKRLMRHMCTSTGCICGPRHGWDIDGMPRHKFLEMVTAAAYEKSCK